MTYLWGSYYFNFKKIICGDIIVEKKHSYFLNNSSGKFVIILISSVMLKGMQNEANELYTSFFSSLNLFYLSF